MIVRLKGSRVSACGNGWNVVVGVGARFAEAVVLLNPVIGKREAIEGPLFQVSQQADQRDRRLYSIYLPQLPYRIRLPVNVSILRQSLRYVPSAPSPKTC